MEKIIGVYIGKRKKKKRERERDKKIKEAYDDTPQPSKNNIDYSNKTEKISTKN